MIVNPLLNRVILGLVLFVFISFPIKHIYAGTGLTIQPIKISQTIKPNSSISGKVLLSNASDDAVVVDMSIQDFVPTAGTDTFQFVGRAPGLTTVRDWIVFNNIDDSITLKKGESREISYTIKPPVDAEPGSHFGVLFFKATPVSDSEVQIKVSTQVGVLVFVTIPGKFEQKGVINSFLTKKFFQSGPVSFEMVFENTGTVHYEPKGVIDISNSFGTKIASVPIEGYAVLPTGIKTMHFDWNVSGLLLGKYSAVAVISDPSGNLLSTKTVSFYALPVWYILSFILTLLFMFFLIRFIKKKVRFSISIKK